MKQNPKEERKEFKDAFFELLKVNEIRLIDKKDIVFNKNKRDKVGEGGQGEVFHGILDGKIDVAIKVLTRIDWKCLSNEIIIIANSEHPNIAKFYGIIIESNQLEMVYQFIDGISLEDYAKNTFKDLDDKQKFIIATGIADAIEFLFNNNFIHRDLKPENIIIMKDFKPVLIDFGLGKVLMDAEEVVTRAKGTINYVSPEVFDESSVDENTGHFQSGVTHKVDVWSFGCILSYMFSGIPPWKSGEKFVNEKIIMEFLKNKKEFPISNRIKNEELRAAIKASTIIDKEKRANISEVVQLLKKVVI